MARRPPRGGDFRDRDRGPNNARSDGPEVMREELTSLGKLVTLIARALVDRPDEVSVRETANEHHPRIELSVSQDDIGKVIGKDGRTAQNMRLLLGAAAMRAGKRAHLDIVD